MATLFAERCNRTDDRLPAILTLIQRTFKYMDERIDPPSSMHQLSISGIAAQCDFGEIWVHGAPPVACVFLKRKQHCMYVGKLAVDPSVRGTGLARSLIELAEQRAVFHGLDTLELEVRIELTENHAAFSKLGFTKISEGSHAGYAKPTFITMHKPVDYAKS